MGRLLFSPTRRTSRSCSTRKSLACIAGGTSPTSSRNRVPPCAASNRPARSVVAPVNAPLACPNSSDSSSVSVTAAQLMATNGRVARDDSSWMKRATRSLPTPDSPVMSTVESTCATRRASSSTFCISSERATMPAGSAMASVSLELLLLGAQPLFRLLELRRDPGQPRVEALLVVVGDLVGDGVAPLVARLAHHVAAGVALADAALLDADDLLAVAVRQVAAGEAGQRPADRLLGAPELQQVLLGLVRLVPQGLGERLVRRRAARRTLDRLDAHQPLQRVQPAAGDLPLALVLPGELRAHRLRRAPAVRVAEAREHPARDGDPDRLDELAPQDAERDRVHEDHAFTGEAQHASLAAESRRARAGPDPRFSY